MPAIPLAISMKRWAAVSLPNARGAWSARPFRKSRSGGKDWRLRNGKRRPAGRSLVRKASRADKIRQNARGRFDLAPGLRIEIENRQGAGGEFLVQRLEAHALI